MTSKGLRIAADLTLPVELAVEATAVIGKRGRGKTFTAKRIVEEVLRAGVTVLIIDPTDVWWGLRSGADGGEGGGLDVYVIGGKHADLPVQETAGKVIARAVLDGTSMVLCPKGLPKSARRRLVGECLTELYDQADGSPILVVIDEADEYAPEGARSIGGNRQNDPLMLSVGAVEDIVRRGRAGGLGSLLITQRVAVLAKSVLEQSDTLIALGVTGLNDINAVAGWIAKHASDVETGRQITASLPALPTGTAWVWSPEYGVLERVEVLPISTFDSSRTPKVGEVRAEPKARKSIDLAALGAEMEKFAEQVKADDPAELRKQIVDLQRQLRDRPAAEPPDPIEVPVLTAEDRELGERIVKAMAGAAAVLGDHAQQWAEAAGTISARLGEAATAHRDVMQRVAQAGRSARAAPTVEARPRVNRSKATGTQPPVPRAPAPPARTSPADPGSNGHVELTDTETLLLATLVQRHPIPMTVRELAVRARRSHTSSTTKTAVSHLRALGLAAGPVKALVATAAGVAAAGGADEMPGGAGLLEWWKERLANAEWDLLRVLADAWPGGLTDDEAKEAAGYSLTSSTPKTALSRLRSLGLVAKAGGINTANDEIGEAASG